MEEETAPHVHRGKYKITKGFIDKVREDSPDNAGDDPPAVPEKIGDQKTKDDAGEKMVGKKTCLSYLLLFSLIYDDRGRFRSHETAGIHPAYKRHSPRTPVQWSGLTRTAPANTSRDHRPFSLPGPGKISLKNGPFRSLWKI
jgi:hypothetical protein